MAEFSTEDFDLVHNDRYVYYKLVIDGRCYFDDFLEEIEKIVKYRKGFVYIVRLMENFGACLLPKEKFRQIEDSRRSDMFEFKKDDLRVYVVLQKPYIYIAMGGFKAGQKNDIENLKRRVRDFPDEYK